MMSILHRSPMGLAWRSYERALERYPQATQMVSSGCLFAAGDLLAQRLKKQPLDLRSSVLTGLFGATIIGPAGGAWYPALDKLAASVAAPGTPVFLAMKTALDGIIFNSFMIASYFLFGELFIDGGSLQSAKDKLVHEFVPTFCVEAALWPPIMYCVFKHVPVAHHLLAVNAVTVLDVALLAFLREMEHSPLPPSSKQQQQQQAELQQGLQYAQQLLQQVHLPLSPEHMPLFGLEDQYQSQRMMPALASMHSHSSKAAGMRPKQRAAGQVQHMSSAAPTTKEEQAQQKRLASKLTKVLTAEQGSSCTDQPTEGCERVGWWGRSA